MDNKVVMVSGPRVRVILVVEDGAVYGFEVVEVRECVVQCKQVNGINVEIVGPGSRFAVDAVCLPQWYVGYIFVWGV